MSNRREWPITQGSVVVSKAGRDEGRIFAVLSLESNKDGEFAYVADGQTHTLEKPKRKRLKHLKGLGGNVGQPVEDAMLRRALEPYKTGGAELV